MTAIYIKALILQRLAPIVTAFIMAVNGLCGLVGLPNAFAYNPERVEVTVSGEVITDVEEILEFYNKAVKKTGLVLGSATMQLVDEPYMESPEIDENVKLYLDTYWYLIEKSTAKVFAVPGEGKLTADDVKSAKMSYTFNYSTDI